MTLQAACNNYLRMDMNRLGWCSCSIPPRSKTTNDRGLALQYSIINGCLGLDWVLLGPRNAADESIITAFMRQRGHKVERLEMNDVEFLRVDEGDLAGLGESILEMVYGVPSTAELGLLIDGIVLSNGKRTNP